MPPKGTIDWESLSKLYKLGYKPTKASESLLSPQWCTQFSPMLGNSSRQRQICREQSYNSPLIHLTKGPADTCSMSSDDSVIMLDDLNTSLVSNNSRQRRGGKKRSLSPDDSVIILSDDEGESRTETNIETETTPKRVELKIPRIPKARLSPRINAAKLQPVSIASKNGNRSRLKNAETVTATSKKVQSKFPEVSTSGLGSKTNTIELQPISIDSEDENTIPKDGANSSISSPDPEVIVVDNSLGFETDKDSSSTFIKPGVEEDVNNVRAGSCFTELAISPIRTRAGFSPKGIQAAAEQIMSIKKGLKLKTLPFVIDTKGDFSSSCRTKQAMKKRKKQSTQNSKRDKIVSRHCAMTLHKIKLTAAENQRGDDEIRVDCTKDKDVSSRSLLSRVPNPSTKPEIHQIGNNCNRIVDLSASSGLNVTNQPEVNEIANNCTGEKYLSSVSLGSEVPQKILTNQPGVDKIGNYYTPDTVSKEPGSLREIVIDGCNIAMGYTNNGHFSEDGLRLVINYFQLRGHTVKVFIPQHQRSMSRKFLEHLYKQGIAAFTPSRCIGGKRIVSYDDRFILDYATLCDGIVVSRDQYRDLYREKEQWKNIIENRLLMPTFVGNCVMFPEDPLGRSGPSLERFLRH